MNISSVNQRTKVTISLNAIPIAVLFLCTALTGMFSQTILSAIILLACAAMLLQGTLFLAYPFMLFYAPLYGAIFGLNVYRLYSLMMLASLMLKLRKNSFVEAKTLMPFAVYVAYALLVVASYSFIDAVYAILNVICCVTITIGKLRDDPQNVRKFFQIYVFVAFVAAFTGFMGFNSMIDGDSIIHTVGSATQNPLTIRRFTATFEDPNYMGFFFTIAVFATVTLQLFTPVLRRIAVVLLYIVLLSSISMTAIVVNTVMWIVYLLATQKINVKTGIASLAVIVLAIALYQYGLDNREVPIIGDLSYRIHEKLKFAETGDMANVTTGRTDLARAHLEYFMNLPLWKMLIGGTPVNASHIISDLYGAAHNEYVDMLLNIGIIGTTIMLIYLGQGIYRCFMDYNNTKDKNQLCRFMCKCVWLAYAMTLTLFLEFRFMLPFFI